MKRRWLGVLLVTTLVGCEPTADSKSDAKSAEPATKDVKVDAKADTKSDEPATKDSKADAKVDAKSDAKADAKSGAQTDAKADMKADIQAAEGKAPSPEPDAQPPENAAPPIPEGPRWTLSCTGRGKKSAGVMLDAEFVSDQRMLVLTVSDGAGQSRTWDKPETLVVFNDLEHQILGIYSPDPFEGFGPDFIRFQAHPRTVRLDGSSAKFRAGVTVFSKDEDDPSKTFDLECDAKQEIAA